MEHEEVQKNWVQRQIDNISNIGTASEMSQNMKSAGKELIAEGGLIARDVADKSIDKMSSEIAKQILFAKESLDDSLLQFKQSIAETSTVFKKKVLLPLALFGFVFVFFMAGALGFVLGRYG